MPSELKSFRRVGKEQEEKPPKVLPEATGILQPAAFSAFTASHTRAGYTQTAAVVMPVQGRV